MKEIIEGLDYCHKHGVLHRNLKPENVMINSEGHVVICDFSLSRIITLPHTPYTPEVLNIKIYRILKNVNDQVVRLEDCGIALQNSYSERNYTLLKLIYGHLVVY